MCLTSIDSIKPVEVGTGWKVFRVHKFKPEIRSSYIDQTHTPGIWSQAIGDGSEAGFHIYKNRRDARLCKKWWDKAHCDRLFTAVIKKVIYKDAFLQGSGDGGYVSQFVDYPVKVVVAKQMMILE